MILPEERGYPGFESRVDHDAAQHWRDFELERAERHRVGCLVGCFLRQRFEHSDQGCRRRRLADHRQVVVARLEHPGRSAEFGGHRGSRRGDWTGRHLRLVGEGEEFRPRGLSPRLALAWRRVPARVAAKYGEADSEGLELGACQVSGLESARRSLQSPMASPHDIGGLIAIGQSEDSAEDADGAHGGPSRSALMQDPHERHAAQGHTVLVAGEPTAAARHKAKRTSQKMIHAGRHLDNRTAIICSVFVRASRRQLPIVPMSTDRARPRGAYPVSMIQMVLMTCDRPPTTEQIRKSIELFGDPLALSGAVDFQAYEGYLPVTALGGQTSFECYFEKLAEDELPDGAEQYGPYAMSTRTGGDLEEARAAMLFLKVVARITGGAYVSDDGVTPPDSVSAYLDEQIRLCGLLLSQRRGGIS